MDLLPATQKLLNSLELQNMMEHHPDVMDIPCGKRIYSMGGHSGNDNLGQNYKGRDSRPAYLDSQEEGD
jgi:hypothetical protein